MLPEDIERFEALPRPESGRLIDFDEAKILTLSAWHRILSVSGSKPYINMRVDLRPLITPPDGSTRNIVIQRPEYRQIEVVGSLPDGIGLPTETPYDVWINVGGLLGTKGVEVIGATRSETIKHPPIWGTWEPPAELFKHWVRSPEEDTEKTDAYRPSDFEHPRSVPTPEFEIKADGEYIEYLVAPIEGGVVPMPGGRWFAVEENQIRVLYLEPDTRSYTLQIASLEEDMLTIKR